MINSTKLFFGSEKKLSRAIFFGVLIVIFSTVFGSTIYAAFIRSSGTTLQYDYGYGNNAGTYGYGYGYGSTLVQLTIGNPALTLSKVYDGNTTAAVTAGTLSGVASPFEVVTVSAVATYDSSAVGTGKTITVVYTLAGADAAKYVKPANYTVSTGVITSISSSGPSSSSSSNNNYYIINPTASTTPPVPGCPIGYTCVRQISICPVGYTCTRIANYNGLLHSSANWKRDLKLGFSGTDVKDLQIFLNGHGFAVAVIGAGSPGNETTYFGRLTQNAVIKFQKANNIKPSVGYFGPKTRAFALGLLAS